MTADEMYLFSSCSANLLSIRGSSSAGKATGIVRNLDKAGGGGTRRLLCTGVERGRLLPVAMSWSKDEDEAWVVDAGVVRQAP